MIESESAMDSRLKLDMNALGVMLFPIICHDSIDSQEMSGLSQISLGA